MRLLTFIIGSIFLLCITTCSERQSFTQETFIIRKNQTIKLGQLDLSITNNGCGRKWVSSGDGQTEERPYCEILVKRGNKQVYIGNDFEPIYIGNLLIRLEQINPWQREEDSIPPEGCKLLVKLLDSRRGRPRLDFFT